ncbi:MAG: hypothetical protein M1274_02325 [Actinobacteria bacterium]|nr:hypothetical protein [Actinomycetota bacterium]
MSVYLIDGYNLMHELLGHPVGPRAGDQIGGRGAGGGPGGSRGARRAGGSGSIPDLEDERKRLIDRIASYMGLR